jgi:tRNA(Ile)-lysidine synthetase-like protein
MKIQVEPGKYVVAVSGGVDSVVLLDLLRMYPGVHVVVAHFDHGIRDDSHLDRAHVQTLAQRYQLPFVYDKGRLGPGASEADARTARYDFLRKAQVASSADAIITAHHQDDVLETAIINLLRGTGRKGLSSLTSGEGIIRPLLEVPKSEIIDYAKRHRLQYTQGDLDREWFILLPHAVSREVMASWLRGRNIRDFDRHALERLTVAGKTAEHGKVIDIVRGHKMKVGMQHLALEHPER